MHPLDILFWSCLALGGVYVVFSVLVGGLSHAVGHFSSVGDAVGHAGHDVGHGHDGGHAHSDFDIGDAHTHGDHADCGPDLHHHDHGPDGVHAGKFSFLAFVNPMAVSGLLLGFGGIGLLARMLKSTPAASALAAGIGGAVMWYSTWFLIARVFGASAGTSHTRREDILGRKGTVTAPIAGGKAGMVALTVGGTRQLVRAVTEEEEPIPVGAQVRIRRLDENSVQVIRLQ